MSNGSTEFVEFSKYRSYLQFLAKTHLSTQYAGKFDRSDIVQKTLLSAFTAREQFQGKTAAECAAWLKTILIHQIAQATREVKTKKRDIKREQSIEAALDASSMRLGNFWPPINPHRVSKRSGMRVSVSLPTLLNTCLKINDRS